MKLPILPEPVIVDGRILFTKAQLRDYGKECYELGKSEQEDYPGDFMTPKASEDPKNFDAKNFGDIFGDIFKSKG
jgi:hypothetical protein